MDHLMALRAAHYLAASGQEVTVSGTEASIDGNPVAAADLEAAYAAAVTADQWRALRIARDRRLAEADGRVRRYEDQTALGLAPADDIAALRAYAQALRDLPETTVDPSAPDWPAAP